MNSQNGSLEHIKEITKIYNINQVNKLLKSGWCLLALEQQRDGIDLCMVTGYILGRTEDVEESKEQ